MADNQATRADGNLAGKVAVVTGAARRRSIGRATALRLAADGADIACLDVARPPDHAPGYGTGDRDQLAEAVDEVRATGRRALGVVVDVRDADALQAAVDEVVATLGRVDICCAMAGGTGFGNGIAPLLRLEEQAWDWVVDVNLKGTWLTNAACARAMIAGGRGGRIVNVASSVALPGTNGTSGMAAYAAAKSGVIVLTQHLAVELGAHGILVNAVSPGMIDTQASEPVRERLAARGTLDRWIDGLPLGRIGQAEEVAAAVAWLCGDGASYVTGDTLNLSGGQVMG